MIRRRLREARVQKRSNSERLAAIRHARGGLTRSETREKEYYEQELKRVVAETLREADLTIGGRFFGGDTFLSSDDFNDYVDIAFDPETLKSHPGFDPSIYIDMKGTYFDLFQDDESANYCMYWDLGNNASLQLWYGDDLQFVFSDSGEAYHLYSPTGKEDADLNPESYKVLVDYYFKSVASIKFALGADKVDVDGKEFLSWLDEITNKCWGKMASLEPQLEEAIEKKLDELEE